jgi:hypothetical protein
LNSIVANILRLLEEAREMPAHLDNLPPIFLKVPDAAKLLNVSTARAYALCRMGIIKTVSLGRQKRVPLAALYKLVNSGGKGLPE